MQRFAIETLREALQQFIQRHRDLIQHPRRSRDGEVVRARRQHRERHREPDEGADRDLDHPVDG